LRFVDANVFIYAIVRPRREMPEDVVAIKERAKSIIRRIDEGERVLTSVVHLSEVANVLERCLSPEELNTFFDSILYRENIEICAVDRELYRLANEFSLHYPMGLNDALALVLMRGEGINEIYSFDTHFDGIDWIRRIID
jgi:hypothetical protein